MTRKPNNNGERDFYINLFKYSISILNLIEWMSAALMNVPSLEEHASALLAGFLRTLGDKAKQSISSLWFPSSVYTILLVTENSGLRSVGSIPHTVEIRSVVLESSPEPRAQPHLDYFMRVLVRFETGWVTVSLLVQRSKGWNKEAYGVDRELINLHWMVLNSP